MRQLCAKLVLAVVALSIAGVAGAADDLTVLEERAFLAAAERVAPSVVSIETVGGLETVGKMLVGQGPTTGLIVSADGYVISSAFNFVQKPSSILVGFADGTRAPAKIVATDRSRMLVLLKVAVDDPLPVPESAPEKELRVGHWCVALGRTFDTAKVNLSVGIVSALGRVWGKAVQTDAKISPSNYGGPLVDVRGRVMGVLVPLSPQATTEMAGVEWYDSGIGFAVTMEQIQAALPRLKQGKDLMPGILGVVVKPADMFADPVELNGVRPNSPAYKTGLKRGDRIVALDGRDIKSRAQMLRQLNQRYAGDSIKLAVLRGSERLERELQLIDKLEPYERPFLGILPRRGPRGEGDPSGVVVRYSYPDGPAAKAGVQIGDRITGFTGEKVEDREAIATLLADVTIGEKLKLEVVRDGKTLSIELIPDREPTVVPDNLPPSHEKLSGAAKEQPATGSVPLKIAEHATQFAAYVPANYDARVSHGLVVWLHGLERIDPANIVKVWQPFCDANELILLVPAAAQGQWQPADMEAIGKAIEQLRKTYQVDPARIVLHGFEAGGALAQRLAAAQRELVRGVSLAQSPIVQPAPENDPATPLSWLIAAGKTPDLSPAIETLRKAKFAVTVQSQGDKARYLNDAERNELLRWIDTLDRL